MIVTIVVDGAALDVQEGVSVAAALLSTGVRAFSRSVSGEPRAALCGMGICHECNVTIDGIAHQRSCLVTVVQGMRVATGLPEAP